MEGSNGNPGMIKKAGMMRLYKISAVSLLSVKNAYIFGGSG